MRLWQEVMDRLTVEKHPGTDEDDPARDLRSAVYWITGLPPL
jgi:hypothetical protein